MRIPIKSMSRHFKGIFETCKYMPHQISASEQKAKLLESGERVQLRIGESTVSCIVFRSNGSAAVLVPEQASGDILATVNTNPVQAEVGIQHGATISVKAGPVVSLIGLVVSVNNSSKNPSRRRYPRIQTRLHAELSTDGQFWHLSETQNLSPAGLLVNVHGSTKFDVGQSVVVRIHIPGHGRIIASAVVKRIYRPNSKTSYAGLIVALHFTTISPLDSDALRSYISAQISQGQD